MRRMVATLILIAGLSLVSCNGLRVYVGKTVPPDFTFNAGSFAECCTDFRIFAVFEEGSETPQWRIVADHVVRRSEARSLVIHYGKVPDRFQQEIPTAGEPPPLVEGKRYLAIAGETSYVPWARVRFIIKNNQVMKFPEQPHENP
jgi:hypothetical protein